jgi:hypothetical protein
MSYTLNKTDGSVYTVLLDGTTNTDSGLTLIGRNYTNYGEIQNENFLFLLENFASALPPGQSRGFAPIAGQLWWDTANQRLKVYTGTEFVPVSEQSASATAPTTTSVGYQWWDTVNNQFKIYNGSAWTLIAPGYTAAQGKSGSIVETVTDLSSNTHTVVNTYTNNRLISVTSYDAEFTTASYPYFTTIKPGINLGNNVVLNGNVYNSTNLGGYSSSVYARTDISSSFTKDVGVSGNIVLTNANISYEGSALALKNNQLNGNVNVYVTTSLGNTRALQISGTTGLATVLANPTDNLGIATKQYTDAIQTALNNSIVANASSLSNTIDILRGNIYSDLSSNVSTLNASIGQLRTDTNANTASTLSSISALDANLGTATTNITALFGNAAIQASQLTATNAAIVTANVGMKSYVDAADSASSSYLVEQIALTANAAANNLTAGLASKANIASPTFTGAPQSVTPVSGDNSTAVATTAFVRGAITGNLTRWQGSAYTVSTSAPSGGSDGDFWFQIS